MNGHTENEKKKKEQHETDGIFVVCELIVHI